ncbi:MAG: hypothetical protein VX265_12040 [Myxococcota bacterium]|nr:hypothetical protein [Myxococcota bacterium]
MSQAALVLLFLLLPLGTTPMECATLLVAGAALASRRRIHQPLLAPAVMLFASSLVAADGIEPSQLWSATIGAWTWALLVFAPPAFAGLSAAGRARIEQVGLAAASAAGLWAVVETVVGGAAPWHAPVDGPFSHHLTLGYALLAPLARSLWTRRWWSAFLIGLGIGCAGASGPLLSTGVLVAALVLPPAAALTGGVGVALMAVLALAGDAELAQRVVLWTAGADVALDHPHGAGLAGVRPATALAQTAVAPGFHFPFHAHDSALQAAAVGGWAGWVAAAWALFALWRHTDRPGRAAIAAAVVGGLTQDTLGDLEVTRALCAWAILGGQPPPSPHAASAILPGANEPLRAHAVRQPDPEEVP